MLDEPKRLHEYKILLQGNCYARVRPIVVFHLRRERVDELHVLIQGVRRAPWLIQLTALFFNVVAALHENRSGCLVRLNSPAQATSSWPAAPLQCNFSM